jgi:hypothetical protein
MPVFLVVAASLVAGVARLPLWTIAVAIATVTAIGVAQAHWKLQALRHGSDAVAVLSPGALLFSLLMHGLLIGLPYLVGFGIRSLVG